MKITCAKCGKRFDAEDHLYICPKCNHYHSQTGTHGYSRQSASMLDVLENIVIGNDAPDGITDDKPEEETEFIQTLNGDQRVYTAQKKTQEKDSDAFSDAGSILKKIGLALCIIIGFIMFISSTLSEYDVWSDDSESWDSGWGDYFAENVVDYGTPMEFDTFTVNVEDVCEPEIDGLEAEDGWKLVQVNFTTESPYGYEDESISTDLTLLKQIYDDGYIEDGYPVLYEDDITYSTALQKQLRDAGLVMEAHYSGNYFCIFEIPEDTDEVTLEIASYTADSDDNTSYTFDESFKMPIEL